MPPLHGDCRGFDPLFEHVEFNVCLMITIRCKECRTELTSTSKVQFCGCPNQMSIVDSKIGAKDLDKVVMVSNNIERKIDSHFSRDELCYQEERRKRKIRKLDFEIR